MASIFLRIIMKILRDGHLLSNSMPFTLGLNFGMMLLESNQGEYIIHRDLPKQIDMCLDRSCIEKGI